MSKTGIGHLTHFRLGDDYGCACVQSQSFRNERDIAERLTLRKSSEKICKNSIQENRKLYNGSIYKRSVKTSSKTTMHDEGFELLTTRLQDQSSNHSATGNLEWESHLFFFFFFFFFFERNFQSIDSFLFSSSPSLLIFRLAITWF